MPNPFDDLYTNKIISFQLCDANIIVKNEYRKHFFARDDDISSNVLYIYNIFVHLKVILKEFISFNHITWVRTVDDFL